VLTATDRDGWERIAWDARRGHAPFRCPECGRPVLLKRGTVRVHHFAHASSCPCSYGAGETDAHRLAKHQIFHTLDTLSREPCPRVSKVSVERVIEKSGVRLRPDLRFCLDQRVYVAVEVQASALDPREIERRTAAYRRLGVHVLWIVPWPEPMLPGVRYAASQTERYLHSLYLGRILYWRGPSKPRRHAGGDAERGQVVPVRFEKQVICVDDREWVDAHGGIHRTAGYEYVSSRYVSPRTGRPRSILDLRCVSRDEHQMRKRHLPAALLWGITREAAMPPHADRSRPAVPWLGRWRPVGAPLQAARF
jgi:competence protein CoiA